MKVIDTEIDDLKILEPRVFEDHRGFFLESFNREKFERAIGRSVDFVQDNHSCSNRHVLRGLHYQLAPKAQAKLVRVVAGEVFDVAVDIRKASSSFGQWVGIVLSAKNKRQFWIPEGFAHGFVVLSERAEFLYKTTDYYAPELERCIAWNDQQIAINWPLPQMPSVSQKDAQAAALKDAEIFQ